MLYKSIALFVLPLLSLHCGKDGKTCEMAAAEGGVKVPLTAGTDLTDANCTAALGADAIVISGKEAVTCDEDPKVGEVCEKKTAQLSKTCEMAAAEGDVKVPLTAGKDLTDGNCVDALGAGATVKAGQAKVTCPAPVVTEVCEKKAPVQNTCALTKENGDDADGPNKADAAGNDGVYVTDEMCAAVGEANFEKAKPNTPLDCDDTNLTVKKYCKPAKCALTKENGDDADGPNKADAAGNDGQQVTNLMCRAVGNARFTFSKNTPLDCGADLKVSKYCKDKPARCALTKTNGLPATGSTVSPALAAEQAFGRDSAVVTDDMCRAVGEANFEKAKPNTPLDCRNADLTVSKYCKPARCALTRMDGTPVTAAAGDDGANVDNTMCAAVGDALFTLAFTTQKTLDCGDTNLTVKKYCKPNQCALRKDDGTTVTRPTLHADDDAVDTAVCLSAGDSLFTLAFTTPKRLDCGVDDDDLRVSKYCKPNRCFLTDDNGIRAAGSTVAPALAAEQAFGIDNANVTDNMCRAVGDASYTQAMLVAVPLDCSDRRVSQYCRA